jgi:hypothetical protein
LEREEGEGVDKMKRLEVSLEGERKCGENLNISQKTNEEII